MSNHTKFIAKPFDGACGKGIKIFNANGRTAAEIFQVLKNEYKDGCVVEELIHQCDELAKFHPQSVNTVRITTILYKDRVEIIHPFFRTGRGTSVVDNGGSGGLINSLDPITGIITGSADEMGNHYEEHPDSHIRLIGYQIPRWDEARAC